MITNTTILRDILIAASFNGFENVSIATLPNSKTCLDQWDLNMNMKMDDTTILKVNFYLDQDDNTLGYDKDGDLTIVTTMFDGDPCYLKEKMLKLQKWINNTDNLITDMMTTLADKHKHNQQQDER